MPQNFSKITINFKTAHPSFIHSKKTLQKVGGTLLNLCKMLGTFERLHICDQSNLEILNIFWTHKSKNKLISEFSKLYFFLLFYFSIGKRQDSTILGACDISIDIFFPQKQLCNGFSDISSDTPYAWLYNASVSFKPKAADYEWMVLVSYCIRSKQK